MPTAAETPNQSTLYYIYDPMCSWCYAFRPIWQQVQQLLSDRIRVKTVLGGLAPDTAEPMPLATQSMVQANWYKIMQTVPGTEFNFSFWTTCQPRRSTYPACRAVLATELQQAQTGQAMLTAIQNAYYLQARNPADTTTLIELTTEIGLDTTRFVSDLNSSTIQEQLKENLALADQLGVHSFPSLILQTKDQLFRIQHSYTDASAILQQLNQA
ncbi:DsbA family protein [uncultured Thiothrix sp.]|uniref:DsbA family protein n=1 Tax=uncultured Thiothrix sp. TaxID=223185 RepID=UPI0026399950|nr:DsbA family protein [uncultured Thiothrix sp.]